MPPHAPARAAPAGGRRALTGGAARASRPLMPRQRRRGLARLPAWPGTLRLLADHHMKVENHPSHNCRVELGSQTFTCTSINNLQWKGTSVELARQGDYIQPARAVDDIFANAYLNKKWFYADSAHSELVVRYLLRPKAFRYRRVCKWKILKVLSWIISDSGKVKYKG